MTDVERGRRRVSRQIETALRLIESIESELHAGLPADAALSRIYRDHPEFGARDRRFYTHCIYAYFRWLGWSRQLAPDELPARCAWSVVLDPATPPLVADIWRSLIDLDETSATSLRLADTRDKPRVIESLSRRITAGHSPAPRLTLAQLAPPWLRDSLPASFDFDSFMCACQIRPPTWLRLPANEVQSFRAMLVAQNIDFTEHSRISGAFAINPPFNLVQFERGHGRPIQVQDLASQAVGCFCRAETRERWWDACSGSGGKTMFLADAVGMHGDVVASDTRSSVLDNLSRRTSARNMSHVQMQVLDATAERPDNDTFDGVLVDAPCTGIGTWPRNPDARWRTPENTVRTMASRQMAILGNASNAVRKGGALVYSVCSVTEPEGPALVREFMRTHPHFVFDDTFNPLTGSPVRGEVMIAPSDGPCDGMYMARLRRT